MQRRTMILASLAALAAAGLTAWALRPQPIVVEVATASKGVFEQTIDEDGKTRVRDRYMVSAPLAGTIGRITLKAGDPIARGQVVAVLAPAIPAFLDARTEREIVERVGATEAQRLRAHAELLKADAQVRQLAADRDRATRLASEGFVSFAAREQAELALQTGQRALEAAQFAEHAAGHDEAQARAALARYRTHGTGEPMRTARWEVRSPVEGAVLKVVQESEAVVPLGAPLVEVANPRSLEAVVDVLSQDSIGIGPGMLARVELGSEARPLAARVRRIEPAAFTKISALGIEEQRVNVILDFTEPLDRVRTLGDAFRVDAHIVTFRAEDALKVPVGALFRRGSEWAVFVIDRDRARMRPVIVARRNGVEAIVERGIGPGDEVVVYPSDLLHDGARVALLRKR